VRELNDTRAGRADTLFGQAYGNPAVDAATSDGAWLRGMLAFERALAVGAARVGLVPAEHAGAIAAACADPDRFDLAALAAGAATQATPVIALIARLRELVPAEVRGSVHLAATSQDVIDSALMLIARDGLAPAMDDAAATADLLAGLARTHRDTVQVGRSFLQHGEVTTFGAACAARLVAVDDALARLGEVRGRRLAVQLGGAVGALGPAGQHGPALVAAVADELGLAEPVTPWHTSRGRVGELAAAIGILAGELAAAAQDVVLLSATELAEVSVAEPGGSSAMPHKRNPARAVLAVACAHRVPGLVGTVLAGMPQELQRSPGRWQAEWGTVVDLVRLLGGTARHTRAAYDGLQVRTDRMAGQVAALFKSTGQPAGPSDVAAARPPPARPPAAGPPAAGAFVDRALAAHASQPRAAPDPRPQPPDPSRHGGTP
jgi:3-carboxy-cis,cis-muconate cycloisomerase